MPVAFFIICSENYSERFLQIKKIKIAIRISRIINQKMPLERPKVSNKEAKSVGAGSVSLVGVIAGSKAANSSPAPDSDPGADVPPAFSGKEANALPPEDPSDSKSLNIAKS